MYIYIFVCIGIVGHTLSGNLPAQQQQQHALTRRSLSMDSRYDHKTNTSREVSPAVPSKPRRAINKHLRHHHQTVSPLTATRSHSASRAHSSSTQHRRGGQAAADCVSNAREVESSLGSRRIYKIERNTCDSQVQCHGDKQMTLHDKF